MAGQALAEYEAVVVVPIVGTTSMIGQVPGQRAPHP